MNKKELEERIKGLEHVIRVYKEEESGKISKAN